MHSRWMQKGVFGTGLVPLKVLVKAPSIIFWRRETVDRFSVCLTFARERIHGKSIVVRWKRLSRVARLMSWA